MTFEEFENIVPNLKQQPLPGESAHLRQKPFKEGSRIDALLKDPQPRLSGVAAIITELDHRATLLLIERQSYKGVHSGQIGFPGGKKELHDGDLEATARRETQEEIGIDSNELSLIMPISEVYIPPSRFLVSPYLYSLRHCPKLVPDPREVQSILDFKLEQLLDDAYMKTGEVKLTGGLKIKTPYFELNDYKVWGATAMMLAEIKVLLKNSLR